MGRFLIFAFCLILSLALPFFLAAQVSADWAFPGDKIEERAGEGLILHSNPTGAKVYIDGIERGRTPLHLRELRPGAYFVRLEREGYGERRFRLVVRSGSVTEVSLELKELVGRVLLKIQGPPGTEKLPLNPRISVDGQAHQSPALELPVGFRTILVRAFGWEDVSVTQYIEDESFKELELTMKPAAFKFSGANASRLRFNPANAGALGTTSFNFNISGPGRGTFTVMNKDWKPVFDRFIGPFETWSQSVVWDGRDAQGEILPDGVYTLVAEVFSAPLDDTPPAKDGYVLNVEIDSSRIIVPLSVYSGKSGLLFAPLPSMLPPGSFQIEGGLLAGDPPGPDGSWKSLPFAAAFRFSPIESLEVSAALNVIPRFDGDAGAGAAGGVKWAFLNSHPFGAAAGLAVSWTGKTALTPFGMASGIELYLPFKLDFGQYFSFSLSPAALWTGDEGFPWEPVPRLLVSGGLLMKMTYVSAGLSARSEFNFSDAPLFIFGGEVKIFPPPSSFVFSVMGGVWLRDGSFGGFGGLGIGVIH